MKRFDCCLCVLHVARVFVIAMVVVCSGIANKSPAQSPGQSWEPECLVFTPEKNTCPVYDGKVNLELPRFRDRPQSRPPAGGSAEEPDETLPDNTLENGQEIQQQPADTTAGFNWNGAILQSTLFLAICHGFRLATEPGTRAELKGPFFPDYWASVKSLRGWADGDEFLVNYIGHPMGGSVVGYRYLIRLIESKIDNRELIIIARTFLNPTRSFANMHRGDWFWKRENRP